MRSSSKTAAAAIAIACLAGCKAQTVSEVVLAMQTDMSLPKDMDTIAIQVSVEGDIKYSKSFPNIGDGGPKLPATLGFLAPADPTQAVSFIVAGEFGDENPVDIRVLREIVTTVPVGEIVTLDMDLHFLCLGTGKLETVGLTQQLDDTCPTGKTCIAGTCSDNVVKSTTLQPYGTGTGVFGDGTCFDGASCWASPEVADLDMTTCTIPGQSDVNVALQTEGIGICGPAGCFVTLDANSPEGWTLGMDGLIHLPPAVCTQITAGDIVDVVTTPVTSGCAEKSTTLPTCGPWSSVKKNAPPYKGPLALAGGQPRPVALALDSQGDLFWINAGLTGGTDGTVKSVGPAGGAPSLLAGPTAATPTPQSPRDLLVNGTGANAAPIWSSATPAMNGTATGTIFTLGASGPTALYSALASPEGLAVNGPNLFWTDFQTNTIFMAPLAGAAKTTPLVTNANYPVRIVADDTFVYWTDEGTTGTMPPDGAIESFNYLTMTPGDKIPGVLTPRAIALETGASGTVAVWWATFDANGSIYRATVNAGAFGKPTVMASMQTYPNGIALDATTAYWTERGVGMTPGSVQSLPISAMTGTAPTPLAPNQLAPGAIAVDSTSVYWVNEGTSTNPSGGVIKLPKP